MISIAVYSKSQWSMLSRVAQSLRAKGEAVSVVYFGSVETSSSIAIQGHAEALGCSFYSHEAFSNEVGTVPPTDVIRELQIFANAEPIMSSSHPYRVLLRRQIEGARRILKQSKTSLLVVCEDGPGGNGSLIMAAKASGLRVIVVPYGIGESKDYDVFLEDKYTEGALNMVPDDALGRFIRQQASHWIRHTVYGEVLLFPAEFVIARLAEGLDLPRPWAVQGGNADCIAVESTRMRHHYLAEGIPEEKLYDVGTLYCDAAYEALQEYNDYVQAFEMQAKIRPDRTSILVALPPSYHNTRAKFSEFTTYDEMCHAVFSFLGGLPDIEITASVHPNCSPENVAAIRASGAEISDEWVVSLIPKHDIFLTDFSSTIRWAIAARKPVVNYDIYRFALDTYQGVPGVITRQRFEDVMKRIIQLVSDNHAYQKCARQQRLISDYWGKLDNNNFERIYTLLLENMGNQPEANPPNNKTFR